MCADGALENTEATRLDGLDADASAGEGLATTEADEACTGTDDAVDDGHAEETLAGTTFEFPKGRHVSGSGCSSENSVISKSGSSSPLKGVCASRMRSTP
jgi:hypothetical protein